MKCSHADLRAISSQYDRPQEVLVFFWTCERCGARLDDANRTSYRPEYAPGGNDAYLDSPR